MRTGFVCLAVLGILGGWVLTAAAQPPGPPPGGPGGPPPRFEPGMVLPPHARARLDRTEEQKKRLAELEREARAGLLKILTEEQKQKLERMGPPPGPGGRPPGPGGPDRPAGDQEKKEAARSGIQWFATWESGLAEAQ